MTREVHLSCAGTGFILTLSETEFKVELGPVARDTLSDRRLTTNGLTVGECNRALLIERLNKWVTEFINDSAE